MFRLDEMGNKKEDLTKEESAEFGILTERLASYSCHLISDAASTTKKQKFNNRGMVEFPEDVFRGKDDALLEFLEFFEFLEDTDNKKEPSPLVKLKDVKKQKTDGNSQSSKNPFPKGHSRYKEWEEWDPWNDDRYDH